MGGPRGVCTRQCNVVVGLPRRNSSSGRRCQRITSQLFESAGVGHRRGSVAESTTLSIETWLITVDLMSILDRSLAARAMRPPCKTRPEGACWPLELRPPCKTRPEGARWPLELRPPCKTRPEGAHWRIPRFRWEKGGGWAGLDRPSTNEVESSGGMMMIWNGSSYFHRRLSQRLGHDDVAVAAQQQQRVRKHDTNNNNNPTTKAIQ